MGRLLFMQSLSNQDFPSVAPHTEWFHWYLLPPDGRRNSMEEHVWKAITGQTKSGMDFPFCSHSFKENSVISPPLTTRKGGKYGTVIGPIRRGSGFQWTRMSLLWAHHVILMYNWYTVENSQMNYNFQVKINQILNLVTGQLSDLRQNSSPLYALIFLVPHLLSEDFKILHLKSLVRLEWDNTFKIIKIVTDI